MIPTARNTRAAATSPLPDLVVYWEDATFDSPLTLTEPRIAAPAIGLKFTGQHAPEGFYLARTPPGCPAPGRGLVAAEDLHHLVRDVAGWSG